ncbi:MAG: hypothetical protein KAI50_02805 [Desulfobacterales bacterium]|nr:hypothetical protein [Desulfobacterales bacterium]
MLAPILLYILVAQFGTKAFWSKLIALPRKIFDNLFMLIAKIVTIGLIVIFIVHIIEIRDDKIVSLEPITVPLEYIEKYGISEQSLTNLLIEKLRFIDTYVSTRRSGHEFTVVDSAKESETTFKYQGTSIPLNLLYSFFLRYVLMVEHKVINGSVIEVGGKICVMIRLVGESGETFWFPKENFKDIKSRYTKITTEITEYCYEQIDSYRMALYFFQKHRGVIVKNGKKTMSVKDIKNLRAFYEDLEKSKKQTDDIIKKTPNDFWALNLKGLIFLELANLADYPNLNNKVFITECYKDALKYFNKSIAMAEKEKKPFPPPHTGMGHVYYEQENFIESFSKYNEAIEKKDDDVRAYLGKANSFLRFFLENNKEKQGEFLIKKNFFFDDSKSAQEVLNNPIQTQTYAIDFYKDAKKQFKKGEQKRSKVTESLVQLDEIVNILKKGEKIYNNKKRKLEDLIECLIKNNPI